VCDQITTTNTSPAKLGFDKPIPHAQTKIQHVDKSDTPRVAHAAAQSDGRELALQTTPKLCLCLLHPPCFPTHRSLKCRPPTTIFGQRDPANTNVNNTCLTKLPKKYQSHQTTFWQADSKRKPKYNILTNLSTNTKHNVTLHVWHAQPGKVTVGGWRCAQILCLRLLHRLCFPTRRSLKCKPPTTAIGQTDPATTNGNNKCVSKSRQTKRPAKVSFDKPIPNAQNKSKHVDKSVHKYQHILTLHVWQMQQREVMVASLTVFSNPPIAQKQASKNNCLTNRLRKHKRK